MKLRILASGAFALPVGLDWRLGTKWYDPGFAPQDVVQQACRRIRKRQGILFEIPGGELRALIRVYSPCLRLDRRELVFARESGGAYFVGISPSAADAGVAVSRIEPNATGWDLGGATLEPWMLCGYPARPWTWASPDSAGPAVLAIYVERTATEIKEWLRGFEPHGYVPFNDVELHWMGQSLKRLWIEDRRLMFSNQCSNHPTSQAVDSTLLGSVCDGALGEELSWDFIDDDYRTYVATGHDLGSLREYLHARGPGLERFEAGYETVSCTGSEDLHALAARMREGDLSQVPRNLRIVLPPDLHKDWERNASVREVLTSRSRVRFTLSATELS